MAALPKKQKAWQSKLPPGKSYPVDEALRLVKEFATAKFNESVDCAVNLGIDASKSDQQVRGSTVMPNGIGKSVRVAVFTSGKNAEAAKAAGADVVGLDDLADAGANDHGTIDGAINVREAHPVVAIAAAGERGRCFDLKGDEEGGGRASETTQ